MTWEARFNGQGSFRGAAFYIQESRASFGRRQKLHEYAFRDVPYAEDLGQAADRWSVEAIVIGDDYDRARDALITALKAKGPGTLVHPYLGSVQAIVESPAQVTESTAEGGMAAFSIQFAQAGANTAPAQTSDTQGAAVAAAASVQSAAATTAQAAIVVTTAPSWVQSAAAALTSGAASAIGAALTAVAGAGADVFGVQQSLTAVAGGALAALAAPASLVATIFSAIGAVTDLSTYAEDALAALTGSGDGGGLIAWGSGLTPVSTTTPSLAIQAANQAALVQIVQTAAAAAAVGLVSQMEFTSYQDAVAIRDPLADQLDTLAIAVADTGADTLAAAIDALRVALIIDVTTRGASLARVYAYTPTVTEPALVIAQRLYGDATRADDLIARNALSAPLFVAGGQPLEVLSAS